MRILILDIDSLRPDHLSCYGYERPTSPNIDRIAARGTRFDRCYCSSSPCVPSRTALASGRFGFRNGVLSNAGRGVDFHIREKGYGGPVADNTMLMRRLRELGQDTICISNFADRHSAYYYTAGWSEFISPNLKIGNETAEEVNEVALRWLEQNADRDNFLLHVNYWDVHRTYRMDPSWAERFADLPVPLTWPDEATIKHHYDTIHGWFSASHQFNPKQVEPPLMPREIRNRQDFEKMVTAYDTAIAYVDHHIGQLFEVLERKGVLEDTAIIIMADHGDALGEHGIYTDHICADECIHHIPLIVRWPGVALEGHTNDSLIYNVDLSPTLCELLGAEAPADWDGASLVPKLRGEESPEREYLVWDHGLYTVQRAVRTRTHLMVRTYHTYGYDQFEPVELYDMVNDRYQTTNIAKERPELVAQCDSLMQDWTAEQLAKGSVHPDPITCILQERGAK